MEFLHEFMEEAVANFKRNFWRNPRKIFLRSRTNLWRNSLGVPGGLSGEILGVGHVSFSLVVALGEFLEEILEESLKEFLIEFIASVVLGGIPRESLADISPSMSLTGFSGGILEEISGRLFFK